MAERGIAVTCPAAGLDCVALVRAVAVAPAPRIRERARDVARTMRNEDGVRTAIDRLLGGAARRLDTMV